MRSLFLITLLLLVGLVSCKKDRLKDEKSILIGEWEWVYSIKESYMTSPPFANWTDTIFPSNVSANYVISFQKKGKVEMFENNELKEKYRMVFNKFENGAYCSLVNNPHYFEILLDNDWDNYTNGCVSSDSLSISSGNFPFPDEKSGNKNVFYIDFFKKVN